MKIKYYLLLCVGLLFVSSFVTATALTDAFQKQKNVSVGSLKVPTVVEVPFDNEVINTNLFAVYNKTTSSFDPYYFKKSVVGNPIPLTVKLSTGNDVAANLMIDNDLKTFKEFTVAEDAQTISTIILTSASPIASSALSLMLDQYVALPNSIEIKASLNGAEKIVVATQRLNSYSINFPKTTANVWTITLTHGQPLRISELKLQQDSRIGEQRIRFLAQPGNVYVIYFNPDRFVNIQTGESGDLYSNEGVAVSGNLVSENNPSYVLSDVDLDGIPDIRDNCVEIVNPDQGDVNNNGRGDACDDFDKDGIINSRDNCINNPNHDQLDTDHDGIGDVCDGEESRLTEKYKFIPWLGIGLAMITVIILFVATFKKKPE